MMGILSDIRVRQPAKDDLVGRQFTVAGIGTGLERTIGMFSTDLKVKNPPRAGTPVKLQVFGDNPGPGSGPGSDLREVELIMFPDLIGYLLYRVEKGDTLTGIVRQARDFGKTRVAQLVAANSQITDPDVIQTGWKLRIPISS